jgi:hypothetical protein
MYDFSRSFWKANMVPSTGHFRWMKTNAEMTRFSMHFNPSETLHFGRNFRAIYLLADANYFRNIFGNPETWLFAKWEQLACSEINTGALIACLAGSEFQWQIPCRWLPKCVQEKEYFPTRLPSWKNTRGGVSKLAFLYSFLFHFRIFWCKNGERETKRSKKRHAKG